MATLKDLAGNFIRTQMPGDHTDPKTIRAASLEAGWRGEEVILGDDDGVWYISAKGTVTPRLFVPTRETPEEFRQRSPALTHYVDVDDLACDCLSEGCPGCSDHIEYPWEE